MLDIDDPHLPGLSGLTQARLCALTGAQQVDLLRLRYRAGKRAILHVLVEDGTKRHEGTVWFFKGDKARRLARRNKSAGFDPDTAALFETFPNDHRMPQIGDFLNRYDSILLKLAGARPDSGPQLLRYRPGLSCTFRCPLNGKGDSFVKLINDDDPKRLFQANRVMAGHLGDGPVAIAPALATDQSVSAIAYGAACGQPLDDALLTAGTTAPLNQTITALSAFWQSPFVPARVMDAEKLLARAKESADFISITAPCCIELTRALVARLEAHQSSTDLRPIHGDMKLEHVFINGQKITLIDTESVSLGPPDYDLAQLYGRFWQAEMEGHLPRALVLAATAQLRKNGGALFDWCLDIVALRLAKYYAQRPGLDMTQKIHDMISRLT